MTATATLPALSTTLPGRYVLGQNDALGSRWVYVVAVTEVTEVNAYTTKAKVYGVDLGQNSNRLDLAGADAMTFGMFDTSDLEGSDISRLHADIIERLSETFRGSLPSFVTVPTAEPVSDRFEEGRQSGALEERIRWTAEQDRLVEDAHQYANDNGLCSEFDRFMADHGLPTRVRDYEVSVHVCGTVTVLVEASSGDDAAELVASDPWAYLDTYEVR